MAFLKIIFIIVIGILGITCFFIVRHYVYQAYTGVVLFMLGEKGKTLSRSSSYIIAVIGFVAVNGLSLLVTYKALEFVKFFGMIQSLFD